MGRLRTPWTIQPPLGTPIDWSNPLCRGISFVSFGDTTYDLASARLGTKVGTVSGIAGPKGRALKTATGAANRVDFTHKLDTGGSAYSFGSVFTQANPAAFQYLIFRELAGVLGGTYTILFGLQNVGGLSKLQISFGTTGFFQGATTVPDTGWHVASTSTPPNGDVTATNAAIWFNGVKEALANSANGGTVSASTQTNLYLNGRPSDNARQLNGAQALRIEWRRVLTDAEHASFNANPWQIFQPLARRSFFGGSAAAATAALTGTVTTAFESDIVTGGKTIILTLTGDTWVAAGGTFDGQRQNIINGLTSAGSDLLGWNNVVKALQGVAGVVRTSDTVVTITLDAQATYAIASNETITVTIPSTALTGALAIVASPTFTITNGTPPSGIVANILHGAFCAIRGYFS